MLSIPMLYIHLGRINPALEPVQVFLHLSVVQLLHRQKQQVNNVRKLDYDQAVPDTRHKVIVLLQQFFNSCQKRDWEWPCWLVKKLKGT